MKTTKEALKYSHLISKYLLNATSFSFSRTLPCLKDNRPIPLSSCMCFQNISDAPVLAFPSTAASQPPPMTLSQLGCLLVPGTIQGSQTPQIGPSLPNRWPASQSWTASSLQTCLGCTWSHWALWEADTGTGWPQKTFVEGTGKKQDCERGVSGHSEDLTVSRPLGLSCRGSSTCRSWADLARPCDLTVLRHLLGSS